MDGQFPVGSDLGSSGRRGGPEPLAVQRQARGFLGYPVLGVPLRIGAVLSRPVGRLRGEPSGRSLPPEGCTSIGYLYLGWKRRSPPQFRSTQWPQFPERLLTGQRSWTVAKDFERSGST